MFSKVGYKVVSRTRHAAANWKCRYPSGLFTTRTAQWFPILINRSGERCSCYSTRSGKLRQLPARSSDFARKAGCFRVASAGGLAREI